MDKNVKISMLLELYSNMLTERQIDITDLYYNQNLSLSEIADEIGITRQAVRKSLIEAEDHLFELEAKLNLLDIQNQRNQKIDKIVKLVKDEKIISLIEELR